MIIGGLVALFILLGFFWTDLPVPLAILQPLSVLALAVTVTLLITPYTWTYDQLLLILPITAVTLAMHRMGVRFPLTATFSWEWMCLYIVLLFFDTMLQVEILNVIVPAVCSWPVPLDYEPSPSRQCMMENGRLWNVQSPA